LDVIFAIFVENFGLFDVIFAIFVTDRASHTMRHRTYNVKEVLRASLMNARAAPKTLILRS